MDNFEGIQHIGEKIFHYLTAQGLLNCRLASKSWKNILDNPIFWLKKLNTFGQHHPREIHNKWLDLIKFAKQSEVPISKITYCLVIKYCKFIIHSRDNWMSIEIQRFLLGLPPIYQALQTKFPDIEVIKLIGDSDETFTDTIECPRHYKLCIAGLISRHYDTMNFITNPLHQSINFGHDLKVLRYLVSKTENIMQALTEGTPITLAVKKDHLEAIKFFIEMVPLQDLNQEINFAVKCGSVEILKYLVSQTENPSSTYRNILLLQNPMKEAIQSNNLKLCQLFTEVAQVDNIEVLTYTRKFTPIEMAIAYRQVEILKHLVSKSNEPNKTLDVHGSTPLHSLAWFPCSSKCPCVEMLKIILPKITNFDVQDQLGKETALHFALSHYENQKLNECLEQKIRILAPLTSLNLPNNKGKTALDYARSDEDISRIFSELNLLNHSRSPFATVSLTNYVTYSRVSRQFSRKKVLGFAGNRTRVSRKTGHCPYHYTSELACIYCAKFLAMK